MNIENIWNKALKNTEIIRSRVQALNTIQETKVPYVLLSESSVNMGDTVVRTGQVVVEKPTLIVPPNNPLFHGFEFENEEDFDENSMINFLIVRGINLPSLKYNNRTNTLDIFEGKLSKAIEHYKDIFQRREDVSTGLIIGPEDCWQFSLLIFVCTQIARNADTDIRKLLDEYRKKQKDE